MLQAPYEDSDGALRYRDVNCTDPCDFGTLWERQWLVTDFVKDDECLRLPHVRPAAWGSPHDMFPLGECAMKAVVVNAALAPQCAPDGGEVAGDMSAVELPDVVGRQSRYDGAIALQTRQQTGERAGRPPRKAAIGNRAHDEMNDTLKLKVTVCRYRCTEYK